MNYNKLKAAYIQMKEEIGFVFKDVLDGN